MIHIGLFSFNRFKISPYSNIFQAFRPLTKYKSRIGKEVKSKF
jgi:hypothetical protein